ncbi:MAG: haloacid dehalogenase type II [Minwuiales bacterium]|nr:haloacid dehalogenase type II [Minwuiales bacterium]
MTENSRFKALTFDVFGTVVDWRTSIAREAKALLGDSKGLSLDWPAFADRWRDRYQPAMSKVRDGEMPWTRLDDLHRMNLDELLVELDVGGLTEAETDHLNRAWHRLDPWPDAVAGLTRLKTGYILATLSNGNVALMVNLAKRAGLPWDAILGAEVVRHYKPQPQSYLLTADYLGLKPEQCLMVAAHNNDLIAASACGFGTAFVARPTEHGPNQTIDLEPARDFDYVARDFVDLAEQLGT